MKNGAIYTPAEFAEFLTDWAIQNPEDKVLDLGTGPGVFVFQAHKKLMELGCSTDDAEQQIYGAEIDKEAWSKFNSSAKKRGLCFPNILNGDFFSTRDIQVDVVIGNPPYVRRSGIDRVDAIREQVFDKLIEESEISRLTDLYVYFLLHAMRLLRKGGRLAVITADSWLNVRYGKMLKKTLLEEFTIENLISIDRPVFTDAQVKPILLLAKKSDPNNKSNIGFVRVKNGFPINELYKYLAGSNDHKDIQQVSISPQMLSPGNAWSVHFKAPELYDQLTSHPLLTPIGKLARAQIGHQTLAKDFFVLTQDKIQKYGIEDQFLAPLAQSAQHLTHPVISGQQEAQFHLFYCSDEKSELTGTKALDYIEVGETSIVAVRGKNESVIGYQNKERIQNASRKNWYDLRSLIEKRGRAEILIPRLIYRNYAVYWNQAGYVPGELFIEFVPHETIDPRVYLAILNSTLVEVLFRCHAQVYGGGTYNMNSGEVKNLPIIDATCLSEEQRHMLIKSYEEFISDPKLDRSPIDVAVSSILGLDQATIERIKETKLDLIEIATATKHK